jgi:hypothetical protein
MATRSAVFATVARNIVGVGGIKAVYSPGATTGVQRIPVSMETVPAAVFLPDPTEVIPGNAERQTWLVRASVWMTDGPQWERVMELHDLADTILSAFRAPTYRPSTTDSRVQSMVIREFSGIVRQQWQEGAEMPWFFVLPFVIELKVNVSATYGPA